ncbi:MAG: hypothetical protein ACLPYS_18835 [Vulcanimicrobiaceae bacterium]
MRILARLAFIVTFALLLATGAGLARASWSTLDELASAQLVPSGAPALLGPINELGRNGWACRPEQAARASEVVNAELPEPAGP